MRQPFLLLGWRWLGTIGVVKLEEVVDDEGV